MMRSSFAFADLHQTGVSLDVFEEDLDGVADFYVFGFIEFGAFEHAFGFESEFDDEIVAGHSGDLAFDDCAGGEVLRFVGLNELGEIVGGVAESKIHRVVHLGIDVAEGVEEI